MSSSFLDICNKCKRPTIETLKEALKERDNLSNSESNFITYMAGFSHYEFAKSLFNEFALQFLGNQLIVFDSVHQKFHIKVLINDLMDLECFSFDTMEISEIDEKPLFKNRSYRNCIVWRNKDGSYINNLHQEVKNLNFIQYQKYRKDHIVGLEENVFSYEIVDKNFTFVVHLITVQRNINLNLSAVLSKVSSAMFVNEYDDRANLSICKLRNSDEAYFLLPRIKWYVLKVENYQEVTTFFDEIKASYILIPYRGEEYNYFDDLMFNIRAFLVQNIDFNLV